MATATKTKLTPLKDHVIVKRSKSDDKTAGGIILPEAAKEKPKQGSVVAVGPGRYNEKGERVPMQVKAGDTIIFSSYAGTEIKVDDETLLILDEGEILAIVN